MTAETELEESEVTHDDFQQPTSAESCDSGVIRQTPSSFRHSHRSWAEAYSILPFGFHSKTQHDASESLVNTRCKHYLPRRPIPDGDIWKRPPPDFRPQNFAPRPPKRSSRDSQEPWKYGTLPGEGKMAKRPKRPVHLPHILQPKVDSMTHFVTHFHDIPDPYEAKLQASKSGTNDAGEYEEPRAHDYREYPPIAKFGLPEFQVRFEKDPYNIHFHTRNLNQIHGLNDHPPCGSQYHGIQMAPPKSPKPEWEARLILPKAGWPNKDLTYSRYRKTARSPHSALLDRIEETLSAQWAKEKLEQQIASVKSES